MKAAVFVRAQAPLEIRDYPRPDPAPGMALDRAVQEDILARTEHTLA
jgi:hypothetical protein